MSAPRPAGGAGFVDDGRPVPVDQGGTVQKVAHRKRNLHCDPLRGTHWHGPVLTRACTGSCARPVDRTTDLFDLFDRFSLFDLTRPGPTGPMTPGQALSDSSPRAARPLAPTATSMGVRGASASLEAGVTRRWAGSCPPRRCCLAAHLDR